MSLYPKIAMYLDNFQYLSSFTSNVGLQVIILKEIT